MKNILLYILIMVASPIFAQNSLKIDQQKTSFFYLKSNLILGGNNLTNEFKLLPSTVNPLNQVSLSYHKKSQRLLQKGYIKNIALSDIKIKGALYFQNSIVNEKYYAQTGLVFNDVWLKLKSKRYRTSYKIGYATLPYGHNPKVDADLSLIENLGGTDMNLQRDLGVFFTSALTKKIDFKISITTGGLFRNPLFTQEIIGGNKFTFNKPTYNKTWLGVLHVGLANFNKNEIGVFTSVGNIQTLDNPNLLMDVKRIGAEWNFKYYDHLHLTNQFLYGKDKHFGSSEYKKVIFQTIFETLLKKKWIIAFNQTTQLLNTNTPDSFTKGNYTATIGYAFTPHIRLKMNTFYRVENFDKKGNYGIYLQFVAGIGQRP